MVYRYTTKSFKSIDQKTKTVSTFLFYIIITMGKSAKHGIWSELLTGRSYGHKLNASEMHFARSFLGHPT